MRKAWNVQTKDGQAVKDEIKRPEQIAKAKRLKEKARLRSGPKELREKMLKKRPKVVMATKQKKGGKRRR